MIRNFLFLLGLKKQKMRALFEVNTDLRYIETFKKDMLHYDESKARTRMGELKRKENRTPEEEAELDAVLNVISQSKAVKNEYEKLKQLANDLEEYISML